MLPCVPETDAVLYSQYCRSRLDEIRNAVGLPGKGESRRPALHLCHKFKLGAA